MYNILIVDQTITPAMSFMDALRCPDTHVIFTHQTTQAIKNVKKNDYDLIVLGDRTDDGSTYDVALAIRDSRKNKHTAVVCVGNNVGKVAKIVKLLKPYALNAYVGQLDVTVARVNAHFESKLKQSSLGTEVGVPNS